jgi:hypothetical protein
VHMDEIVWRGMTRTQLDACPCRKLCTWRTGANRVMLVADDSAAQIALWCAHWAVALQRTA